MKLIGSKSLRSKEPYLIPRACSPYSVLRTKHHPHSTGFYGVHYLHSTCTRRSHAVMGVYKVCKVCKRMHG
jgi:hypothetical protein